MARSLKRAGHDVTAWNRTRAKAEPLAADGVTVATGISEAVDGADAVVTMLFDTAATAKIKDELVAALGTDAIWIQAGTVGVDGIRALAAGVDRFVDAPVLGTRKPAEDGKLVVLASGAPELLSRAEPVFAAIGARTVVAGDAIGQASALKLACNAWVALITAGTAQSLTLASALGVDPHLFLDAIEGGPTGSPYARVKGEAILAGDTTTSFAIDGVVKDVGLIIEAADGVGYPTDLLTSVRSLYLGASEAGHGEEDMGAVASFFTDPSRSTAD